MSLFQATIRNTNTRGQVKTLRKNGEVPGIIYGGKNTNEKTTKCLIDCGFKRHFVLKIWYDFFIH